MKKVWILAVVFFLAACGGGSGGGGTSGGEAGDRASKPVKAFESGYDFFIVREANGTLYGWGKNDAGQLGRSGAGVPTNVPDPEMIPGVANVVAVDAGYEHSLVLERDGKVYAFGSNSKGALGTGDDQPRNGPVAVQNVPKAEDVAAGSWSSYIVTKDGDVYSFGDNRYGLLGRGPADSAAHPVPEKMVLPAKIVSVEAEGFSTVLIDENGDVYGLGYNGHRLMGQTDTGGGSAVKIPGLKHIVAAALGGTHALYLDRDGKVYGMGDSKSGQLGVSGAENNVTISVPLKITGIPGIKMVSANKNLSMLLDIDGHVWTCGANYGGQLGLGYKGGQENTPKRVPALENIVLIHAENATAYAVDANGTVYYWGNGSGGYDTPVVFSGIKVNVR